MVLGKNGKIYWFNKSVVSNTSVGAFDPETNTWSQVIGNGKVGYCPDGTLATSCPMLIDDLFVTSSGKYYLIDNGMIRTIADDGTILTLYGKSGSNTLIDSKIPLSIQSSGIVSIDVWDDNGSPKIVFLDNIAAKIMEFVFEGNLVTVAGDGTQASPISATPAISTSLNVVVGNSRMLHMGVNPQNGNVFYPAAGNAPYVLNRASGKWENFFGGSTNYVSGDGLPATSITAQNNSEAGWGPLGIVDGKVLFLHTKKTSGIENSIMIKAYDLNTKIQEHVLGTTNNSAVFCPNGTAPNACTLQFGGNSYWSKFSHDSILDAYMINVDSNVRLIPADGTTGISTLVNFGLTLRYASSYRNASNELIVIACAANGLMYKYNQVSNTVSALPWPSSTISCSGDGLVYVPSRNSILFIYKQNYLSGIAEYLNP